MRPAQRYGQTQKETASRERLMVLLFEAALRHMRTGAAALEAGRAAEATFPLTRASDIVVELHATLDTARAPELCRTLADVYQFVTGRLLQATLKHEARLAREAERAFAPLVEAFQGAVAQVTQRPGAAP